MRVSKNHIKEVVTLLAATLLPFSATATPTVEGYVIKWTEEGWHQVQLQSTYESVCNGGRQCTLPAGVYTVINHGTGQRFMNIVVPKASADNGDLPRAPVTSTGQVVSYAAGDDGDYQLGVSAVGQRFQDNGDGTFDDTFTGLTWLGVRDCIPIVTWQAGVDYANNISASSGDCPNLSDESEPGDWRLPNIKELFSLVNLAETFPAWEPGIPFSGSWIADPISGIFWSSTSFEASLPGTIVYSLNSGVSEIRAQGKTTRSSYSWPVRDSN